MECKIVLPHRCSLLSICFALFTALSLSLPAQAIPLCSGPTSVADLGAEGCTFNNLTFSDFSFSGSISSPFDPLDLDPARIFVDIMDSTLSTDILTRVPAVGLVVRPQDPTDWTTSGMFSSVSLGLSYVVEAAGATFDQYQLRGAGIGGSLRGGSWRASLAADPGSATVAAGSWGPYLQIGTVTPNTSRIQVSTGGGASPGIAGGSSYISSLTNVFTLGAAPVPVPGTLGLGFLALAILATRKRASSY